jgi:glycosyltransferase involved in cell wall biosynthesis
MKVSVLIPTYNEEKYIENCLMSLINSDFDFIKKDSEILVIDGISNDKTREIVKKFESNYSYIHLIDNKSKFVPHALNLGIRKSSGKIIIRLDAHSFYAPDYISKLLFWKDKLKADNVGGVSITNVMNANRKTIAIKQVLSNKYGVGNSLFRIGVSEPVEADTVPFGCYDRSIFEKLGYYDERLTRNQDIELNKRIKKNGGKIYLVPDIKCTYFARETYSELMKNNFGNGLWNILTVYYTKDFKSLSLRHFIPLAFVLSVIVPAILSVFWIWFLVPAVLSLFAYLSLVSLISVKLNNKQTSFMHLLLAFLSLHISYGFGSLYGFIKLPAIIIFNK